MPKLTLQFEGRVLKEYAVGQGLTIGRMPDNTIIIENPAVSGHHARIVRTGATVVIEDLKSTNGTFINGLPVTRRELQHGDVVLVGKHQLVFDRMSGDEKPGPAPVVDLGDTLYLDTKQHRALRATLDDMRGEADRIASLRPAAARAAGSQLGVLRVVGGRADRIEYDLESHTSIIGRSNSALVHLRGWFKPAIAVAIARNGDGYVATALGGKPVVNSKPLNGRHHLKEGDVIIVSGLTLEFHLRHDPAESEVHDLRKTG